MSTMKRSNRVVILGEASGLQAPRRLVHDRPAPADWLVRCKRCGWLGVYEELKDFCCRKCGDEDVEAAA